MSALLAYLLFVLLVVFGPGIALQRLFRLREDPALVLPVGILFGSAGYAAALVLHHPSLFPALVLLVDLSLLLLPRKGLAPGPSLRGALLPAGALVLVLALTDYHSNRLGEHGGFILDKTEDMDTAFHVGIAYELAHSYPPQVPGLAGVPLHYHYGPDLLRGALARFAKVSPYDCLNRFEVTLSALALLLVLRSVAAGFGGGMVVLLASWSLLLSDFSFLAPLLDHEAKWWAGLLNANILPAVILANGNVPALALAAGALLALRRHEEGEGGGWLAIAALLALGVPFFKVFLAAQLLLGLGVAFLLCRARKKVLFVLLPCALATLALVLGEGRKPVFVTLDPFGLVQNTLDTLNLPAASGVRLLGWSLLWVAAGLGLRFLGAAAAFRALVSGRAHAVALAATALSGIPLGLLVRITLREQPGYDEAGYFVEQGGALLWIFAACGAAHLLGTRRWILPILACLALPSTVEFVGRKMVPEEEIVPRAVLRAMAALEAVSAPGDVVLERPHLPYPPPPVVFAGRRVPFTSYIHYLPQFTRASTLASRHARLNAFFGTKDRAEAEALAQSLGARFVCLYPDDRLRFDPTGLLELVFTDGGTTLYRITQRP